MGTEKKILRPSVNPAHWGSLEGAFRHIILKLLQGLHVSLPAIVESYDASSYPATVSVQPALHVVGTDNSTTPRGTLHKIPVLWLGGKQGFFEVELEAGDKGFLIACDRDISDFVSKGAVAPASERLHDFADSFFIPCAFADSDTKITIKQGRITVTAETEIVLDAPEVEITSKLTVKEVEIQDTLTLNGSISSDVQLNGNLNVDGNITATGTITPGN